MTVTRAVAHVLGFCCCCIRCANVHIIQDSAGNFGDCIVVLLYNILLSEVSICFNFFNV